MIIDSIGFQFFAFIDYVIGLAEGDGRLLLVMIGLGFILLVLLLLMASAALGGKRQARKPASKESALFAPPNLEKTMSFEHSMSLEQIEREMLDIREQYKTGRISAEVYVGASKTLYEKSIGR